VPITNRKFVSIHPAMGS